MSQTALSAAYKNVSRRLDDLDAVFGQAPNAAINLNAAIVLAEALDARIGALITGVGLLRHEATRVIAARKGTTA
jgi:hypothetical protein